VHFLFDIQFETGPFDFSPVKLISLQVKKDRVTGSHGEWMNGKETGLVYFPVPVAQKAKIQAILVS